MKKASKRVMAKQKGMSKKILGGHNSGCQKFLVFTLADKKFGLPLSKVKEVVSLSKITTIPHVPKFFKGLINLRGKIISVIDMRIKMNIEESEFKAKKTSIVITDVGGLQIGAIVDDVNAVDGFEPEQIKRDVDSASNINKNYLDGVAHRQDSIVLLVDVDKIFNPKELGVLKSRKAA